MVFWSICDTILFVLVDCSSGQVPLMRFVLAKLWTDCSRILMSIENDVEGWVLFFWTLAEVFREENMTESVSVCATVYCFLYASRIYLAYLGNDCSSWADRIRDSVPYLFSPHFNGLQSIADGFSIADNRFTSLATDESPMNIPQLTANHQDHGSWRTLIGCRCNCQWLCCDYWGDLRLFRSSRRWPPSSSRLGITHDTKHGPTNIVKRHMEYWNKIDREAVRWFPVLIVYMAVRDIYPSNWHAQKRIEIISKW